MSGQVVFITGGSGHLGLRVIFSALAAGYRVRAAVRSEEKANTIKAAPSIKGLGASKKLDFVIVEDMLMEGAYDKATQGTDYIIHIASPITSSFPDGGDFEKHFIEPALQGTLNILTAARKAAVKRVVITSSVVAIIPWKDFTSGTSPTVFDETSRTVFVPGPYASVFEAYAASKVNALNHTEAWVGREKPGFDVVHIFPGFIIGKDELVNNIKDTMYGTNKEVLNPVTGGDDGYIPSSSVHLHDVAFAHVKALDPKIPSSHGYVLSAGGLSGTHWEDSLEIVAQNFSDAVKDGRLANNGKIVTLPVKIDEAKSQEVLGFKFKNFEEQVDSVVAHYLELLQGQISKR